MANDSSVMVLVKVMVINGSGNRLIKQLTIKTVLSQKEKPFIKYTLIGLNYAE